MHDPAGPLKAHRFDYVYGPEKIADLTEDDIAEHVWAVGEILEPDTFAGLQVEAVVTPDGAWHEPDNPFQLWNDPAYLERPTMCFSTIGRAWPCGTCYTFREPMSLSNVLTMTCQTVGLHHYVLF